VPPNRRMGIALAVEDDRWTVTMAGMLGERPPADLEGSTAYAAQLPVPAIAQLIGRCEPLGDAAVTRFPAHRRWRYERRRRPPAGFVVLGDALSSFNPVYGQGMSVAVQEAVAFGRCLDAPTTVPRRIYAAAARIVDVPWDIAVGNDLRFPEVVGRRGVRTRLVNRYVARLYSAAVHDPVVTAAFVGRAAELELVRAALATDPPPYALLHVHGPGGVGKTALLRRWASEAEQAGRTVIALGGRRLDVSGLERVAERLWELELGVTP
jgi:hypothetical protein